MRDRLRNGARSLRRTIGRMLAVGAAGCALVSCATSFDMSGERIGLPGPEWGVVIGSVLVRPEAGTGGVNATGHNAVEGSYAFDVVQIQPVRAAAFAGRCLPAAVLRGTNDVPLIIQELIHCGKGDRRECRNPPLSHTSLSFWARPGI